MKIFTYWSNKTIWHEALLFSVLANGILEADKDFQEATGINPIKTPWIGVTVENLDKENK